MALHAAESPLILPKSSVPYWSAMDQFVSSQHVEQLLSELLNSNPKPVWVRIPQATRLSGLGRSYIYELIASGKIRSRVLKRRRDATRGVRLVSYDSLCAFIESEGD